MLIFSVSKFSMKTFQGSGLYLIQWQWCIFLPIYIYILNSSSSAVFWKRLCTCWTKATWQLISISTSFVSAGRSRQWYVYPGKAGFCFFSYCLVLWCAQILEYIMARWSYSFICTLHYLIIIIMQKYLKVLNVCIPLTHFSYYDCANMCTLSYYHNKIGCMTHLPLFKVRS